MRLRRRDREPGAPEEAHGGELEQAHDEPSVDPGDGRSAPSLGEAAPAGEHGPEGEPGPGEEPGRVAGEPGPGVVTATGAEPGDGAGAEEGGEAAPESGAPDLATVQRAGGPPSRTGPVPDQLAASLAEPPPVRELPRILAVANQKGGVGKTTTTVNLGAALAELDYRVLVVDLDPQGNATTGLGIDARNFELSMYDVIMRDAPIEDCIEPTSVQNLFVAPATIDLAGVEIELVPAFSRELKLKKAIDAVVDDFDFVLIDCPPSLGLITVNGLAAASEVLVPIQCEYYALEGLEPAAPQRAPGGVEPQRRPGGRRRSC